MLTIFICLFLIVFVIGKILNSMSDKHDFYAGQVFDQFDFLTIYAREIAEHAPELEAQMLANSDSFRIQVISALKDRFNSQNLKNLSFARRKDGSVTLKNNLLDMDKQAVKIIGKLIEGVRLSAARQSQTSTVKRRRRR